MGLLIRLLVDLARLEVEDLGVADVLQYQCLLAVADPDPMSLPDQHVRHEFLHVRSLVTAPDLARRKGRNAGGSDRVASPGTRTIASIQAARARARSRRSGMSISTLAPSSMARASPPSARTAAT